MIWAWLGAIAIGLTLGLLGSGGSILTVPVLVYLVGMPDKVAIAGSLAIVGLIAAVAAVPYAWQRSIHWRSAVFFGIPGIAGTYLGAALSAYVSGTFQLLLFALVMLLAAALMLKGGTVMDTPHRQAAWKIVIEGLVVGVLTGLVGVGGGFLIVPALVLLGGLSMRLAVGTSLLIIAAKSLAGFAKYLDVLAAEGLSVDWMIIAIFSALGIAGSFAGNHVGKRVPQRALKRGFAVFLIIMGTFILFKEGSSLVRPSGEAVPIAAYDSDVIETFSAGSFLEATSLAGPSDQWNNAPFTQRSIMSLFNRLFGQSQDESRISESEFVQRHKKGDAVLDVRTPGEFSQGHLADAVNVDVMAADFAEQVDRLNLLKDQPVYLYCRTGNRSQRAAEILRQRGDDSAVNVGGYEKLVASGAESER